MLLGHLNAILHLERKIQREENGRHDR